MSDQHPPDDVLKCTPDPQEPHPIPIEAARQQARALDSAIARIDSSFSDLMRATYRHERDLTEAYKRAFETLRTESEEIRALLEPARGKLSELFRLLGMKYTADIPHVKRENSYLIFTYTSDHYRNSDIAHMVIRNRNITFHTEIRAT
uniref:Uncharacterized protein n=1 Tax=Candidatus Kentrum sp. FM TaxID=2126340 RepID=A0A450TNR7_9GAMM|nr:MAG: hypothetical protein BECKFM1743C_GA0114222_105235 [Candidatus Kentron sp. FM]